MAKNKKQCIHINTRGNNDGKRCERNVCKKSITGNYCTFHLTQENRGFVCPSKQEKKEHRPRIIIKKDIDYGRYIHIDSGLVFFSVKNLIVYAKQEEGEIYPLTFLDIDICKQYRFKYCRKLYEIVNKGLEA